VKSRYEMDGGTAKAEKRGNMTPKIQEAINLHCRHCMQSTTFNIKDCVSKVCILNLRDVSDFRRVRNYCASCAADNKPEECTGEALGAGKYFKNSLCPLFPYRLGRNLGKKSPLSMC